MKRSLNAQESMKTQILFKKPSQPSRSERNFTSNLHYLHLVNSVFDFPGVYSCAIDSFIELMYYCVFDKLKDFTHLSTTPYNLLTSCQRYDTLLRNHIELPMNFNYELLSSQVRAPLWNFLVDKCPTFRARDCNAQFSEIFQERVFCNLNDLEKSVFVTSYNYEEQCGHCGYLCKGGTETFLQYIANTEQNLPSVVNENWPALLFQNNFSIQEVSCSFCNSPVNIGQYFVSPANILFLEIDPTLCNLIHIYNTISLRGIEYELKGAVRNSGAHFTVATLTAYGWAFIDDLKKNTEFYHSFTDLRQHYQQGWFFCCYVLKSTTLCLENYNTGNSTPGCSQNNENLKYANFQLEHDYYIKPSNQFNIFNVNNTNTKTIRSKFHKNIVSGVDFSITNTKTNSNNFNLKSTTEIGISQEKDRKLHKHVSLSTSINKPLPVKKERLQLFISANEKSFSSILFPKEAYKIMQKFHKQLSNLKIYQCEICREAWPALAKYSICSRCKRDKKIPKKFSSDNNMIPSTTPNELSDLTQVEEMLIARALPFMNVYCKPRGGQRAYKGHVITFPTEVQTIANILPNLIQDIPIVRVTSSEKYKSKDFRVRRRKVVDALSWLIANNPLYHDVTIDYLRIKDLPVDDDVICDVANVGEVFDNENDVPVDTGPEFSDQIIPEVYSSFVPSNSNRKSQKKLMQEHVNETVELEIVGDNPLNEFNVSHLATLAFPTLFPDSKGDPTNLSIEREISVSEVQSFALKLAHLLKFGEEKNGQWCYKFASHPRFAYWGFNMLYRRRLLAKGNLYVKRHPEAVDFTLEEFNQMLSEPTCFRTNNLMSKIFYYSQEVTGSNSYWSKIREDLKAIVKQEGVPTIFFTLSMAEYHWPDFLSLLNCSGKDSSEVRKLVQDNPHLVDWYFTQRTEKFVKSWLYEYLDASWHWYRFEYASRGSIHCHGLAKLKDDPGLVSLTNVALKGFLAKTIISKDISHLSTFEINQLQVDIDSGKAAEIKVCSYIDNLISTLNPGEPDSWTKPSSHPCKMPFNSLKDFDVDYEDMLNSVQKHICSTAYCLRDKGKGLHCRFNYPFECTSKSSIKFTKVNTKDNSIKYRAEIVTARNDPRLNRFQRVQLQGWRANCDLSVVVDYHSCLEYLTKYASKPEKLSTIASDAFYNISLNANDENFDSVKVVKKIMMQTVGLRDMSIQEVCHSVLSLKLYSSSFNVITISLNGARKAENIDGKIMLKGSMLDLYAERHNYTNNSEILNCNFVSFHSSYCLQGEKFVKRKKNVVVRIVPCYPSNPNSEKYAKYCKFSLLKFKVWSGDPNSAWNNLADANESYISCWHDFVRSEEGEQSIPNYLIELDNIEASCIYDSENDSDKEADQLQEREDWMFLSDLISNSNTVDSNDSTEENDINDEYWIQQRLNFDSNSVSEMPMWINSSKSSFRIPVVTDSSSDEDKVSLLNIEQRNAFDIVHSHLIGNETFQLLLLITGKAGYGKSFLIDRFRHLLVGKCLISALFGLAAYNVYGKTLHFLLKLPIKGKRNCDLDGSQLLQLQENLANIRYIIIDEYSVISQKDLAWVNRRCKQATGISDKLFGGINIILLGDLGQLPPVSGRALYCGNPRNELEAEGLLIYSEFKRVVALKANQRVNGTSPLHNRFKELLSNIRDGNSTRADWELFLSRTPGVAKDVKEFRDAIKLSFGNKKVAEDNFKALHILNAPIAKIDALHNKKEAAKLSSDDMGGLQKKLFLSVGARVMLLRNLWTDVGLCNGAIGTVYSIVYVEGQKPPSLPVAIMIQFDNSYRGPSFSQEIPNLVPVPPCTSVSESLGYSYERTQFPIKLAWAITIHKSQGLTLDKVWIDLGKRERSAGLSYVALSRVRNLESVMIEPMSFERLSSIRASSTFEARVKEEERLNAISIALPRPDRRKTNTGTTPVETPNANAAETPEQEKTLKRRTTKDETSSPTTPKLFRSSNSSRYSPSSPSTAVDISGFVGSLTGVKENINKTRHYFTVYLKRGPTDFAKIIVSNHKNMKSLRQQILDFFHNKEPVCFSKVLPGKEIFFFNAYSAVMAQSHPLNFNINDAEAVKMEAINDQGLVLSVVGKIKFDSDTVLQTYMKEGKQRTDKMREGLFSDNSRTLKMTIWGDLIDLIKENHLLQICNLSSREYNEKIVMTTNFSTCVCYLTDDMEIWHDTGVATEDTSSRNSSMIICCPKISSIKLSSFKSCKYCRSRLEIVPGSGLASCPKCKRDFTVEAVESDPLNSQLVANLEVETSNESVTSVMVTIFGQVLKEYFEDVTDLPKLKLQLLQLSGVDLVVDKSRFIVQKMKKHGD